MDWSCCCHFDLIVCSLYAAPEVTLSLMKLVTMPTMLMSPKTMPAITIVPMKGMTKLQIERHAFVLKRHGGEQPAQQGGWPSSILRALQHPMMPKLSDRPVMLSHKTPKKMPTPKKTPQSGHSPRSY